MTVTIVGFHWRYERSDGTVLEPDDRPVDAVSTAFSTQGDAESWIGETWEVLLGGGVDAVTLFEEERQVYGPMSLHPA